MGFPVGYSEMPKLVLHLLCLLSHLGRLSSWLLRLTGLDIIAAAPDDVIIWAPDDHRHYNYHDEEGAAADRLEEHSPAVRFDSLSSPQASGTAGGEGKDEEALALPLPEGCAVCLGDYHAAAEVRRARGCRHVFHRKCLDRWAAHGQHTCPLCRAPLLLPLPQQAS